MSTKMTADYCQRPLTYTKAEVVSPTEHFLSGYIQSKYFYYGGWKSNYFVLQTRASNFFVFPTLSRVSKWVPLVGKHRVRSR